MYVCMYVCVSSTVCRHVQTLMKQQKLFSSSCCFTSAGKICTYVHKYMYTYIQMYTHVFVHLTKAAQPANDLKGFLLVGF